jgi:hypothetical protein
MMTILANLGVDNHYQFFLALNIMFSLVRLQPERGISFEMHSGKTSPRITGHIVQGKVLLSNTRPPLRIITIKFRKISFGHYVVMVGLTKTMALQDCTAI